MKKYKGLIIVSSIVILLPMLLGLILWNRLPDTMVTHWGAEGAVDGAMGKAFASTLPSPAPWRGILPKGEGLGTETSSLQ